ncbi:uncharacterized protein LOC107819331 [Nicotiana tabacum]|uniref:Uncharacterized protein LOC107819331 n=2 Tax=Nicotiana TaxID=4085 RepID=A0A1S4CIC1_TOBAC|nr:PREDICTED: uncharacterized protein LOC104219706 [Nicotiana sylvestris]XP_016500918.1 PREDICTED: uncharacterized protein LOC107819331 [Nicotiana tabacum]
MQTLETMEEDDVSPKVSLRRNGSFICVAAPFLYDKLPEEPLKLTILKLDGSSFDIEVARNGSVEDLKRAVEEAFSHCKISWLHVWGHFCLSYCGQKLLTDDDLIGTYGIKDGDELSFVRHVSIGYNPVKVRPEGGDHHFDEPSTSNGFDDKERKGEKEDDQSQDDSDNDEDSTSEDENDGGILSSCQYRLFHLFRGWLSYQKLANSERRVEQKME